MNAVSTSRSLIQEIESSLGAQLPSQRSEVLRRITDLFLSGAENFSAEQTELFDDVFCHLVEKIERNALIELSGKLAPVSGAPINLTLRLASNTDLNIAGPILEKSSVLSDRVLSEIARTMSQGHLAAIAGRDHISEVVSEVLVDRGDEVVLRRITCNAGAQFSRLTFASLLSKASQDAEMATTVAGRVDIPPELFEQFVIKASNVVRNKLLATTHPLVRNRIEHVLSRVARRILETESPARRPGISSARASALGSAQLKEKLLEFARSRRSTDTLGAFATYCDMPVALVKNIHRQAFDEGMIIIGKSAGLGWPELKEILIATMPEKLTTREGDKALFEKFLALSPLSAQRIVRFLRGRQTLSKDDIKKLW